MLKSTLIFLSVLDVMETTRNACLDGSVVVIILILQLLVSLARIAVLTGELNNFLFLFRIILRFSIRLKNDFYFKTLILIKICFCLTDIKVKTLMKIK